MNAIRYNILILVIIMLSGCTNNSNEKPILTPTNEEKIYTLRVMTYNIYHGETNRRDGVIHMDLYGQIIKGQSPDLVALQEVDKNTTRVGGLDLTKELSKRTGLDGYFCKFIDYRGGEYGSAILSKFPVVDFNVKSAYNLPDISPRAHAFAKVKLDEDVYIYFNTSHLSLDLRERKVQIQELLDIYREELDKAPLLICGDLNTEPDSEEMQILYEEFAMVDLLQSYTFSARTGLVKKIDYILYPKNNNWVVVDFKRICRIDASDHCALVAELKFKVIK